MVECDLAKVEVAGSNPVSRSNKTFRQVAVLVVAQPPERQIKLAPYWLVQRTSIYGHTRDLRETDP